jgi:transposase
MGAEVGRLRCINLGSLQDGDHLRANSHPDRHTALTSRRYQSGKVDYDGHISHRVDREVRGLRFEVATVILTRSSAESVLRRWGLTLRERVGFKKAAVAVARKRAVLMHAMLKTCTSFDRSVGAAA